MNAKLDTDTQLGIINAALSHFDGEKTPLLEIRKVVFTNDDGSEAKLTGFDWNSRPVEIALVCDEENDYEWRVEA